MKRLSITALLTFLTVATLPRVANAQSNATPNLRTFEPSIAPTGGLMISPTTTPEASEWNGGALFSWAWRPLVLRNGAGDDVAHVIESQAAVDWFGNIGIGKRTSVGVLVPTVLHQTGESNEYADLALENSDLIAQGVGDLTVLGQLTLVTHEPMGGFGLATVGSISLPTGDPNALFADGTLAGGLKFLGEYALPGVALRASAGVKFRSEERSFSGTNWGNDLSWAFGVSVHPQVFGIDPNGHWTWALETFGQLPAGPSAPFTSLAASPAQLSLSTRYALGDVSIISALQTPLDGAAGVPLARAILGLSWAPRMLDSDHDGVDDAHDECPDLQEDRDGFEDSDGCPDFDNDSDSVPDAEDQCPKQQEDLDDYEDDDGCPEQGGTPLP